MINLFLIFLFLNGFPQPSGDVTVQFDNLKSRKGQMVCVLFKQEKGFPNKPQPNSVIQKVKLSESTFVRFKNVPYGEYAVAVYHDENMNNKMDASMVGIPEEGYGASNDAKNSFSPPDYEDAAFMVDRKTVNMSININY